MHIYATAHMSKAMMLSKAVIALLDSFNVSALLRTCVVIVHAVAAGEYDDDIQHAIHATDNNNTTISATSVRLRLVEQAAVIRHLELQLAAVTSETGAAAASRHIASTIASAVAHRQSNNNTKPSNSSNTASKKYTATTGADSSGSSDDMNGM
jgi:hypothetical protein